MNSEFKPHLEEYLIGCGIKKEDALEMVLIYFSGSIAKIKKKFEGTYSNLEEYFNAYSDGTWKTYYKKETNGLNPVDVEAWMDRIGCRFATRDEFLSMR